jgi:hypothetical protein
LELRERCLSKSLTFRSGTDTTPKPFAMSENPCRPLKTMETQSDQDHSHSSDSGVAQTIAFSIDLGEPRALASIAEGGTSRRSILVRIEPQEVLCILSATEPERVTRTFAEALAKRTALSAIEKDIPTGVELSLSAKQIDHLPADIENRIPDFYMNGNMAWLPAASKCGELA